MEAYFFNMLITVVSGILEIVFAAYPILIVGGIASVAVCVGCGSYCVYGKIKDNNERDELKLKITDLEKKIMELEETSLENLMVDSNISIETEMDNSGEIEIEVIDLQANEINLVGDDFHITL